MLGLRMERAVGRRAPCVDSEAAGVVLLSPAFSTFCAKCGVCARAGMAGGGRSCADKEAETMIAAAERAAAEKAGRSTSEPAISVLHNVRSASLAL